MRTVDPMDTSPSLLLRNCLSKKFFNFFNKITAHILTLHIQHRLHGTTRLCNISTDNKGEAIGARDTNPVVLRCLLAHYSLYRNQRRKVHTSVFSDCITGEKGKSYCWCHQIVGYTVKPLIRHTLDLLPTSCQVTGQTSPCWQSVQGDN